MRIRTIEPEEIGVIRERAARWWGGSYDSDMFSKWYVHHFRDTCLAAEIGGELAGFVMGFCSQTEPDSAYIRIVMVSPEHRGGGVGRALYEAFFERVTARGRSVVRCVTAPHKANSLAFHAKLGFRMEPQAEERDGLPVAVDYDGRGGERVVLVKRLA
ncbi:GNAT family N-acetyltransferase [Paenibacillus xanthanilyticus]|uniref:GNAT family N-acetyltransferase n=1 Tax=Paenibacillus xanthanilyticus TaxID=1783531 RepID=A0ABV8KB41_9BACL